MGTPHPDVPALVRVHRADVVADVFEFTGPKDENRLDWAMRAIAAEGNGVLLYLRTGSNGETAVDTLRAFLNRKRGAEGTARPTMDFREFGVGAQILSHLGLKKIRVITNSIQPFHGLSGFGLEIVGWVPMVPPVTPTI